MPLAAAVKVQADPSGQAAAPVHMQGSAQAGVSAATALQQDLLQAQLRNPKLETGIKMEPLATVTAARPPAAAGIQPQQQYVRPAAPMSTASIPLATSLPAGEAISAAMPGLVASMAESSARQMPTDAAQQQAGMRPTSVPGVVGLPLSHQQAARPAAAITAAIPEARGIKRETEEYSHLVEAKRRMTEALLLDIGSVLKPNTLPFESFDDVLERLLPYHLYTYPFLQPITPADHYKESTTPAVATPFSNRLLVNVFAEQLSKRAKAARQRFQNCMEREQNVRPFGCFRLTLTVCFSRLVQRTN